MTYSVVETMFGKELGFPFTQLKAETFVLTVMRISASWNLEPSKMQLWTLSGYPAAAQWNRKSRPRLPNYYKRWEKRTLQNFPHFAENQKIAFQGIRVDVPFSFSEDFVLNHLKRKNILMEFSKIMFFLPVLIWTQGLWFILFCNIIF